MADRCLSSTFKGKGRLLGYRWQINERGVANIVEPRNSCVEGIVYWIDRGNRRQLDRNEGVSRGYYEAEHLPVHFTPLEGCDLKTGYVAKNLETMRTPRQEISTESSDPPACLQGRVISPHTESPSLGKASQQRNNALTRDDL